MSPAKIDFKKHNIWLQNYIFTKKITEYIYIHITSSTRKLLSILKIYSIYNVNYRLALELQPTYQITISKRPSSYHIISICLRSYIKIPYYCLTLHTSKYMQSNIIKC